jgi:hypothetical protein
MSDSKIQEHFLVPLKESVLLILSLISGCREAYTDNLNIVTIDILENCCICKFESYIKPCNVSLYIILLYAEI